MLSAALIGQMPELGSLNEKQVAALTGLAPINHDSVKYAGKRRIEGNRTWLRHLLNQAALVASNHNLVLKIFARKRIIIANTLLAKNNLWKAI